MVTMSVKQRLLAIELHQKQTKNPKQFETIGVKITLNKGTKTTKHKR